jgi:hypothetical protein
LRSLHKRRAPLWENPGVAPEPKDPKAEDLTRKLIQTPKPGRDT